jgi:succinyl-CoA synthetase beta subunit
MLGFRLKTKQTSPEGVPVRKLMIAESIDLKRELYFAILMVRHRAQINDEYRPALKLEN